MRKNKRNKMLVSIAVIILYLVVKMYVTNTSTLQDDRLPELVLKMLAIN